HRPGARAFAPPSPLQLPLVSDTSPKAHCTHLRPPPTFPAAQVVQPRDPVSERHPGVVLPAPSGGFPAPVAAPPRLRPASPGAQAGSRGCQATTLPVDVPRQNASCAAPTPPGSTAPLRPTSLAL